MYSMCSVKRRFDGYNGDVWRIFPKCSLKKLKHFFANIIRILLRDQSNASHAVSHLESIFKKLQHVTFWLLNHCLDGPKWTGNNYLVKIRLTGSKLEI